MIFPRPVSHVCRRTLSSRLFAFCPGGGQDKSRSVSSFWGRGRYRRPSRTLFFRRVPGSQRDVRVWYSTLFLLDKHAERFFRALPSRGRAYNAPVPCKAPRQGRVGGQAVGVPGGVSMPRALGGKGHARQGVGRAVSASPPGRAGRVHHAFVLRRNYIIECKSLFVIKGILTAWPIQALHAGSDGGRSA